MPAIRITPRDIAKMCQHWLGCPPNGYLGSNYGSDIESLLQSPMASALADGLIAKCREDVPILQAAPSDMVEIYAYDEDMDRKVIKFVIGGELIDVGGSEFAGESDGRALGLVASPKPDDVSGTAAGLLHKLEHVTMPTTGYW